jgi:hypothetical protein
LSADVEAMAAEVVLLLKSALAPLQARQEALQATIAGWEGRWADLGLLRERLAVVEARPPVPGPPGEPGAPGHDGKDGEPGKAGLTYQGVHQDGKTYDLGDVTTWAGSTWHCNERTTTKPGESSKAWTLMVKRGRDGKP